MRFFILTTCIVFCSTACSQKSVNDFSHGAGEVGRSIADGATEAYHWMISGFEGSKRPTDSAEQLPAERAQPTDTPQQSDSDSSYSGGYVEVPPSSSEDDDDEQDSMYY